GDFADVGRSGVWWLAAQSIVASKDFQQKCGIRRSRKHIAHAGKRYDHGQESRRARQPGKKQRLHAATLLGRLGQSKTNMYVFVGSVRLEPLTPRRVGHARNGREVRWIGM